MMKNAMKSAKKCMCLGHIRMPVRRKSACQDGCLKGKNRASDIQSKE